MRKNNRLSFISKILLFFNLLAIVALLLCYLATVANPAKYWYIAFFGLGYPFILLANVLFIIYWLFRKRWFALLSLGAIIAGYNSLTSTIGFKGKTTESFVKDSATIKLMTYNVHQFKKFGAELDSSTRNDIFELIKEESPDIVGFQEFFSRSKGSYAIKDSVKKILKTSDYYFQQIGNDYEATGIALFSKLPITHSGDLELDGPKSANGCVWADVEKDGKKIRVFVVHLASISFQPEDYEYLNKLKAEINTEEDVASGKRIVGRLKRAFIRRSEQVKKLKSYTDTCSVPYIIMGDFNDTPVSYTLNTLSEGLKSAFKEKGSGLAITYNGEFPNFQIDYILASQHFNFKTYNIIKKKYSDHFPVTSEVSLSH